MVTARRLLVGERLVVGLALLCVFGGAGASVASASRAVSLAGTWTLTDTCRSSCAGRQYGCTLLIKVRAKGVLGGGCEGAVIKGTQTGDSAKFTWAYPGAETATFAITENAAGTKFTGAYKYPNGEHGTSVAIRVKSAPSSSG
jgi:hypothetical protein